MKKIIALMLVLMLTLTVFVACTKDPETSDTPDKPSTQTPSGPSDDEPEENHHDSTGGLENQNQHDGEGLELPIVPIQ